MILLFVNKFCFMNFFQIVNEDLEIGDSVFLEFRDKVMEIKFIRFDVFVYIVYLKLIIIINLNFK